jgi:hypothetical protein
MSATINNREKAKLPDWAISTMNQIEDLGFTNWIFDWEYPLPDIDLAKRLQIRDETHVGQQKEVNLYAEAMKRGDKFPPGVVTLDNRIVDFNTRLRAVLKLNWPHFPVFIIQENFEEADPFTQDRLMMLGGAFNSGGPKSLTRQELTKLVARAAKHPDQWDTARIGHHLHVPRNLVANVFAQFRAEDRAEKLGVPFNGSVNASTRAKLGQRSDKLADEPFREITRLAQQAGLTTSEVSELCGRVVDVTTGDPDRLAVIANERQAREPQIARFTAGGKRRPPLAARVRSAADFLAEHSDHIDQLVDANPNTRAEFLRSIEAAADVLVRLISAQRDVNSQEVLA